MTACDSMEWQGTMYTTSGIYYDTLQTSIGCDSIISIDLTINNSINGDTTTTVACDSAVWQGTTYTASGMYYDTLQTAAGCDSVLTLDLTINNSYTAPVDVQTACDSLVWQGTTYTTSGMYYDSLQTITGCDSILTLDLTINDSYSVTTVPMTACDSMEWQGTMYTTSGIYYDTLQTAIGCDSIISIDLTINNSINGDTTTTVACDSAVWQGTTYTTSGMYYDTLQTAVGCDSVLTLDLTINNSYTAPIDTLIACDNLTWNGRTYTFNSNHIVNIIGNTFSPQTINIRAGDTITWINDGGFHNVNGQLSDYPNNPEGFGNNVSSSLWTYSYVFDLAGTYNYHCDPHLGIGMIGSINVQDANVIQYIVSDTLSSVSGCDSILTMQLIINKSYVDSTLELTACDSMEWQGTMYTTSGMYYDTLQTTAGCDSIISIDLTINSSVNGDTTSTIACDSAVWQGTTFTISGMYHDTLQTAAGCDSVLTLDLTINNSYNAPIDTLTACDSLVWQGTTYTASGIYYDSLQTLSGCDSILILDLTINNTISFADTVNICDGDSAIIHGLYQSVQGNYIDTIQSISGCDSIANIFLNVDTVLTNSITIDICVGDSSLVSGIYYSTDSVIVDTLLSISGCDSIVATSVVVHDTTFTTNTFTLCYGDSVLSGNGYKAVTGIFVDTMQSQFGCDSIIVTDLTILNDIPLTYDTTQICPGDSIQIGPNYFSQQGPYYETFLNANGCDSVVEIYLELITPVFDTTNAVICFGDSLLLGGVYVSVEGAYNDTLVSTLGCDSIVTTLLTVDSVLSSNDTLEICQGDSVLISGIYVSSAGNYLDSLVSVNGCDSVVNLNLIINNNIEILDTVTICANDSVEIGGFYYRTAGIYTDSLNTVKGCDSLLTTTLIVNPVFDQYDTTRICFGDSLLLANNYQSNGGDYVDTLQSINGCDSLLYTHLIVDSINLTNDTLNICQGDSILFGGQYIFVSGNYTDTLQNLAGCDSILNLNLVVDSVISSTDTLEICQGDSAVVHGVYQSISGVFTDTLSAQAGCDSISTIQLVVHPNYLVNDTLSICTGDSIIVGGGYQTSQGVYVDSLTSFTGCDSIISTYLQLLPTLSQLDTTEICDGDSVLLAGSYQTQTGTYTDTLSSASGCDSIVETHLIVLSPTLTVDTVFVCQGDSALIHGDYYSTAGIYLDTLQSIAGCDSAVSTSLIVNPILSSRDTVHICSGDSILLEGNYQTNSGLYLDTISGINGCDSIFETYLSVDSVLFSYDTIAVCFGDSALIVGNYYSQSGVYSDTLTAFGGCDSISTTVLDVSPYLFAVDTMSICTGDSALLAGAYQHVSGVYYDSLQSVIGCDSVIETLLIVDTVLYSYETAEICFGDSLLIAGEYQSISGVYNDSLTAQAGCDSIHVFTLIVLPQIIVQDSITICYGDSALLSGSYQSTSGLYVDTLVSSNGCDSIVLTDLTIDTLITTLDSIRLCFGDSVVLTGSYQTLPGDYVDTLVSQNGCDSIVTTNLSFDSLIQVFDTTSICFGDSISNRRSLPIYCR